MVLLLEAEQAPAALCSVIVTMTGPGVAGAVKVKDEESAPETMEPSLMVQAYVKDGLLRQEAEQLLPTVTKSGALMTGVGMAGSTVTVAELVLEQPSLV